MLTQISFSGPETLPSVETGKAKRWSNFRVVAVSQLQLLPFTYQSSPADSQTHIPARLQILHVTQSFPFGSFASLSICIWTYTQTVTWCSFCGRVSLPVPVRTHSGVFV